LSRFVNGCNTQLQRLRNPVTIARLLYSPVFLSHPVITITSATVMPTYPAVGADQYHVNDPQHGTHHEPPPQFDLYNPHPSDPDPYYQSEEPYMDEPGYSLPQGQSMEPLGPSSKEEVSFYPDEANPTSRRPRCVIGDPHLQLMLIDGPPR
jgi:hypothetical protein